jgi:protein-serine/threonine kinase
MSSDETHVELARTVDDLSKWLLVVEGGLAALLDRTLTAETSVIEEEMEAEAEESGDGYLGQDGE